ncbi:hypothetical protein ABB37_03921 [Leptomonas pyrrhocoris]|uniref:Uncharacterized protein n=1 Tax=Leptomonas pyrrhocoris TaxID=157538 RepID=A0A0M9G3G4_LEPPY|nr:hypothetical protein ABB37_03921 [Leptomonas pyrrhocoris]XP_015660024.1 hypothetical protein ABB37_03921 [Leptomonas pyrrhocoris]KPA81584.1 hypothetical protein ABB37_03921 [Leptomonas pyrrhocoris]KPA81585.1 hypothetical protein ABB37_03921 [Leptomonas pyrrhocoris]|eukprot:XP_015660023.1 hypothetical protein ABB37_03921 [Leptomonas pyrrhocoris]
MSFSLEKLNKGLTRLASVRSYPAAKKQYVAKNTKGRVFRIGVLHRTEITEGILQRNRRGFINAQLNTVAHAPSLYHWLFHRCGIPFAETQVLTKSGGLKVDDVVVSSTNDLESQLSWETFQQLDIQVRSSLPALQRATTESNSKGGTSGLDTVAPTPNEGPWVPALKRALHRSYHFMYLRPGISISSEESDPRSFVHRLAPSMGADPAALLGLNILRPIGYLNGMKGIGITTNDVSMVRYWNNESLGNFGVYDVRFPRGTPPEVLQRAARELESVLQETVQTQMPMDVGVTCSCLRCPPPPPSRDVVASHLFPSVPLLVEERLLVTTPLFPYRMVRKLRKNGAFISLVRSGPFVLHASLVSQQIRPFNAAELALLFTFERRLKTNRMVLSLREFDA